MSSFPAFLSVWIVVAIGLAWTIVLPTIGLLWVVGWLQ